MIDKCAIIPISACVYAAIVSPLLLFSSGPTTSLESIMEARSDTRIFWPMMAAISVVLAVRNRSRLGRLAWSPPMIGLLAYLAFAGASVLWAFKPESSFVRFAQQAMILTSIVVPAMLAAPRVDILRGLFLCFAFGSILNVFFVLNNSDSVVAMYKGYPGYFLGKNYLGEVSAIAFFLALH